MSNPTYRYGILPIGANYEPGNVRDPADFLMAESLEDVRRVLTNCQRGNPHAEMGSGKDALPTPMFGGRGDGAYVYMVRRWDPEFAEVLDEPGDRARHAAGWLWIEDGPSHVADFGPRGGLTIYRNGI